MQHYTKDGAPHAERAGLLAYVSKGRGPAAALFYLVVSASMGFFNKCLLTTYSFDFPMVVLGFQMLAALLLLLPLRLLGVIDNSAITCEKCRKITPVTLLYSANVMFGLMSLSKLNIPMYNTLKRMTPVIVLLFGLTEGKRPATNIAVAVGITTLGINSVSDWSP